MSIKGFLNPFLIVILSLFFYNVQSNNIEVLKKKKDSRYKEIDYINSILKSNEKRIDKSENNLILLESKIVLRSQIIDQTSRQVELLDHIIQIKNKEIYQLDSTLKELKKEYANTIYHFYKSNGKYNRLIYLLSAKDLNQSYKRLKYLQQYVRAKEFQKTKILSLKDTLKSRVNDLQSEYLLKESYLNSNENDLKILESEKKQQTAIISGLKKKEKEYRKKLIENKKIASRLEEEIKRVLEIEAQKLKMLEKNSTSKTGLKENQIFSNDFKKNKGKLPWPVEKGIITSKFGEHAHPVYKGIKIKNNGIDITTTPNENVKSVFGGIISRIFTIKGTNYTLIIRHGNFLTVYQNITQVKVKQGDQVTINQIIGLTEKTIDSGNSFIHFEIWENFDKLNPEEWLIR